jgi:Flp pilus assembly pilin Flp
MDVLIVRTWFEAKFISSDRGAAMVEYGFLLALIAIIAIAAVSLFGGKVSDKFSSINSSVG